LLIVDAQVHTWKAGKASSHHVSGLPNPFTADDLRTEMRAAGVDRAVLVPPAWDPDGNLSSLEAARMFPAQFAVAGSLGVHDAADPALLEGWRRQPGMLGMRLIFNSPATQAWLTDGTAEWLWSAAERADIPIMLLVPGAIPLVSDIAARYPGLRLCIDHLGIPRGLKDAAAFAHLPQLLALARHPNVTVKAGGIPAYQTTDSWPYPSLHGYLRQVYDAFGPERIFWATDLTRMSCSYTECVTMFTEGIPWLSSTDKRLIMGEAVCRWLDWRAPV
jgi:predicted TIM-barrel fold metal-dependent hydrolase